jgi:HlyD family secretion protein
MKIRWRLVSVGLVLTLCAASFTTVALQTTRNENRKSTSKLVSLRSAQISALGTISPRGRIRHVAAPANFSRVGRLLVDEGQSIIAGQVIAHADDREIRLAELQHASAQVSIAQSKLDKLRAGPDPHELHVLDATLLSARESFEQRQREFSRSSDLLKTNSISLGEFEDSKLRRTLATLAIQELEAKRKLLTSVRYEDVRVLEAEVQAALSRVKTAEENLAMAEVVSPMDGLVLRVHVREGERPGESGILDLGDTRQMQVIAEVYEADVIRLRIGATAKIILKSRRASMDGVVTHIRPIVGRKSVLDNDPVSDSDARVVEAIIDLKEEDSLLVESLSNASVTAIIRTDEQ